MSTGHRGIVRRRTGWLFLIFAVLYLAVVGRLVVVQVMHNREYQKWASRIRYREIPIAAARGAILDRNMQPLAMNLQSASVYINKNEVLDLPKTAYQVASLVDIAPSVIEKRVSRSRDSIVWLGLKMDPRLAARVAELGRKLPGIGVRPDTKRVYPAGGLAAHILGFVNFDNKGIEGMESLHDGILSGRDGLMRAELDAERRVIAETRHVVRSPRDGKSICLTIDMNIQNIAEQALARMAKTYKPQSACAIVMDPHSGELLALANLPGYDPNRPRAVKPERWRNRAVADLYEPGSTLKVVTVAAALNEGIDQYEVVAQCKGCEQIKGGRIRCSLHHPFMNGHGGCDMYRTIQQSCNIAAAHLARRMGAGKLYDYEKSFGLLDKAEAGFGCEAVAKMLSPDLWRPMKLANVGFGQGIAVTPLQMACVYGTIANGGVYVQPRILREIRAADGTVVQSFSVGKQRRVISKQAAFRVSKMLNSCVQVGTGKTAKIMGRKVAGKTGSAQVALPKGGYESGAFIASFMGFAPAYKPRLVIAVVVNRPKGSHWGATVAAPVFQEIGEKALWYLKVPSDVPAEPKPKPKHDPNRKQMA